MIKITFYLVLLFVLAINLFTAGLTVAENFMVTNLFMMLVVLCEVLETKHIIREDQYKRNDKKGN